MWFEGDILPARTSACPGGIIPTRAWKVLTAGWRNCPAPCQPPHRMTCTPGPWSSREEAFFSTSGSVTTQNVPEAGNLTGILSVTEQGYAVSMIVFGTGKIHMTTRIAGVWRGWTTLYSPLSKPTPAIWGQQRPSIATAPTRSPVGFFRWREEPWSIHLVGCTGQPARTVQAGHVLLRRISSRY